MCCCKGEICDHYEIFFIFSLSLLRWLIEWELNAENERRKTLKNSHKYKFYLSLVKIFHFSSLFFMNLVCFSSSSSFFHLLIRNIFSLFVTKSTWVTSLLSPSNWVICTMKTFSFSFTEKKIKLSFSILLRLNVKLCVFFFSFIKSNTKQNRNKILSYIKINKSTLFYRKLLIFFGH